MNTVAFFALVVVAIAGFVSAKNNYFVKTYFVPGSNCTHASGKTQEQFAMNKCLDTMENYVDGKTDYVDQNVGSDYKCTTVKKVTSYHLRTCQSYDSKNDIYPTAY